MRANTVKNNQLVVRCIFCGDSQRRQDSGHLSIDLSSGMYHCFRCQAAGRVSHDLLFKLQLTDFPSLDYNTRQQMPEILPGPGSSRRSLLDRYHSLQGDDVFCSWWNKQHVGYYLRNSHMKKLWGFSGYSYPGAPYDLLSTPDAPLRFVEGPYDVLTPKDVCFFGIPSLSKISKFFKEHYFILVPDGDLWTDQARFRILKALVDQLIKKDYGLLGIQFIPKAQDPDEASGRFIPVQFFKEKLWQSESISSRAQRALASLLS